MKSLNSLPPFRTLSATGEDTKTVLGPLFDFIGNWSSKVNQGWNLIAVPGGVSSSEMPNQVSFPDYFDSNHGFVLETIPYIEQISFEPIAVLNRGQFLPGKLKQEIQEIGGVFYKQTITSSGVEESNPHYKEIKQFFAERGFSEGTVIHEEQGILLNMANLDSYGDKDFPLARMGVIPHGNTMLCLGSSVTEESPQIEELGTDARPTTVDASRNMPLEYGINTYDSPTHSLEGYPFYPHFIPAAPNLTLINANKGKEFTSVQHITLDTENGNGGLLNIPFVGGGFDGTKIDTNKMKVDYWMSKYKDADGKEQLQLQYVQNINLIFPATINPALPINWPHIGLNTLHKVL